MAAPFPSIEGVHHDESRKTRAESAAEPPPSVIHWELLNLWKNTRGALSLPSCDQAISSVSKHALTPAGCWAPCEAERVKLNAQLLLWRTSSLWRRHIQFSPSVVSGSLRPHGPQHSRPPCPSPTPGACSHSCPSHQWGHPTISSSVVPFSSCLQSFPASGGQSTGQSIWEIAEPKTPKLFLGVC